MSLDLAPEAPRMTARSRRWFSIAATATAVLGITACTTAPTTDGLVKLPEQNQSQWSLPLDRYLSPFPDPLSDARQVLLQDCYGKAGMDWKVAIDRPGSRPGESWNGVHRKLFDVDLAKKYGYGNSREVAQTPAETQAWLDADRHNRSVAENAGELAQRCLDQASQALGESDSSSPFELAEELAFEAYDEAFSRDEVKKAVGKWHACMVDLGLADLPAEPTLMPPPSIDGQAGSGVDEVPVSGVGRDVPSSEVRVASVDATCRDSSGYAAALYQSEWELQAQAVADNADHLKRYRVQADELLATADAILEEYAARAR
jgi:hypothetical protein